jgi:hypothetical protein
VRVLSNESLSDRQAASAWLALSKMSSEIPSDLAVKLGATQASLSA